MAAATRNILIIGSMGLIGRHITNAIINSKSSFGRIAVLTSQSSVSAKADQIEAMKSQGVEIKIGDLTSEADVTRAYDGIDTIVSCVGRPVIHLQVQLIQWAEKHPDMKRFFPSEYGTDVEYGPESADEKPHQQKLKVRAYLRGTTKLVYTFIVTGPYANGYSSLYLAAKDPTLEGETSFDVQRKRAVLIGDGDNKVSLTTMQDVGKLVVAALLHQDAVRNKAIRVNSFTTTPHNILAEFEKQCGGEKWSVTYTSLDKARALEQQAWANGEPRAGGNTLHRIWASGGTLYAKRDNDLIGMEDGVENLETAVRRAISDQQTAAMKA